MLVSTTVVAPATIPIPELPSLFQRVWPSAVIALGMLTTVAWVSLLGYGLVALVGLAF